MTQPETHWCWGDGLQTERKQVAGAALECLDCCVQDDAKAEADMWHLCGTIEKRAFARKRCLVDECKACGLAAPIEPPVRQPRAEAVPELRVAPEKVYKKRSDRIADDGRVCQAVLGFLLVNPEKWCKRNELDLALQRLSVSAAPEQISKVITWLKRDGFIETKQVIAGTKVIYSYNAGQWAKQAIAAGSGIQ